jgi:two-component system, cell cycle sensor histidine kinase and response regulator CckA
MDMHLIVPAFALAIQVVSIFFAFRLWRNTGKHVIAIVIILIVSLMAFRRAVTLTRHILGGTVSVDLIAEGIALIISCLILFAIIYITQLLSREIANQEAVVSAEARYRTLFEQSPDGVLLIDARGTIVDFNDRACRQLGYTREEFGGLRIADIEAVETAEEFMASLENPAKQKRSEFESKHRTKNGELRDVYVMTQTMNLAGRLMYHAIWRDVTERKHADVSLKKYASLMKATFESTADGILVVDSTGKISEFNEQFVKLWNIPREIISSKDDRMALDYVLAQLSSPDQFMAKVNELYSQPDAVSVDILEFKDGRVFERYSQPLKMDDIPFGRVWNFRNITERKRAEDSLWETTNMLKQILNTMPQSVFWKDRDCVYLGCNEIFAKAVGLDHAGNIIGKTDFDLPWPRAEAEAYRADDKEVMTMNRPMRHIIEPLQEADGTRLWIDTSKVPLVDQHGSVFGVLGVYEDITGSKQVEEALRSSEARFRTIIEKANTGIQVVDIETKHIIYANPEICRILGYTEQDLRSFLVTDLAVDEEQLTADADFNKHAKGEIHTSERTFKRKDGSLVRMSIHSVPMEMEGRHCLVGFLSDVTEKRLLEEERLKTQKLEAIGTLAGGIAHDFNNLLQGVFGFISLAKLKRDDRDKSLAALEEAEKALHMSVNLTNQLLTFSKGGKPLKKTIDLLPVIENAAKFALSGSRTDYRVVADNGLWQADADEGQISQVIQNVVLNADQAMPDGGQVVITARNVHSQDRNALHALKPGNYIEVAIKDDGVGIPEKYLRRIFDPYFTTKEKGSGLGLATSYAIIKNHNGLIDVKSERDKGTTFSIYIPATTAIRTGKQNEPATPAAAGRTGRVLIMDDEQVIRNVAGELIRALGHSTEFAVHGNEAIEKYQEAKRSGRPFDVVILDLTIRGGMGGAETIQRLLEIDPGVKAIVSSGYSDDSLIAGYQKQGFKSALKKPYNVAELRDTLNILLKS